MRETQAAVQQNAEQELLTVTTSAKELKYLHDCGRSFLFSKLSLNYEGYETSRFKKEAVKYMAELLKKKESDFREKTKIFFEYGYKRSWFKSDVEFISAYNRDLKKVIRLGEYIQKEEYTVKEINYPYNCELKEPLNYRGCRITAIKGVYDFLLEKNGNMIGVLLKNGTPKYSMKAKKLENRSDNSIELLSAYLGLACRYHGFNAEIWYLNNKDDTGAELMELYEHRPGKNIVKASFEGCTIMEIYKKLMSILQTDECQNCDRCIHKNVCQVQKKDVRIDKESGVNKPVIPDTVAKIEYTDAQQRVITHLNGPMCVVAVPGAGKTKSLVERMVYLIKKGVKPCNILFVTFTKKAAKEIEERVKNELNKSGINKMPNIHTYNSLGFNILKENPLYLGGKRIKLATDVDKYNLIYKALTSSPNITGMSYAGMYSDYGIVKTLDKMFTEIDENNEKNPFKGKEMFREMYADRKDVEGILNVYHAYKRMYQNQGYISYDDQVIMTNELFENYPVLKKRYAEIYQYIMVDEFQDTCLEQAEMIYGIAKQHNNIVVVGDDDQSIYKWRGGSSSFMLHFKDDFPDAELINMSDNFRSGSNILKAANNLIAGNGMRFEKTIVAHSEKDEVKPVFIKGEQHYLEKIVKTILSYGCKPGDICILARSNKRLDEVHNILNGIVPVTIPKDYIVEDKVFMAIYDVLTLFFRGMNNDEALYRVFSYYDKAYLLSKKDRQKSLYENMLDDKKLIPVNGQNVKYAEGKSDYMVIGNDLVECFDKIQNFDIRTAFEYIIEKLFHIEKHKVVDKLCDMAYERGVVKMSHLYEIMSDMILYNVKERVGYDESEDAVNLLTSHDSKGKEFNTVIIYGVEDYEGTEEEIRVLYVSMTRAKKNLYMLETALPKDISVFEKIRKSVKIMGC